MRTTSRLTLAATLLAASMATASAADMAVKARPAPPPMPGYDWTGYYGGVGFGGLWGDSTQRTFDTVVVGAGVIPGGTVSPSFENSIVSFHGGQLHQFKGFGLGLGSLVVGLDHSATFPIDHNNIGTSGCFVAGFTCGTRIQSLFTTGAVLGLAWDKFLISARGGWAGGFVDTRTTVTATGAFVDQTSWWHHGWYVGGGLDWSFYKTAGSSWIIGVEYQHVDLGTVRHVVSPLTLVGARDVNVTADVIKAKLTMKLDGPPLFPW